MYHIIIIFFYLLGLTGHILIAVFLLKLKCISFQNIHNNNTNK